MPGNDNAPHPPEDMSEETRTWIDSLSEDGIRDLIDYLEGRIESSHTPIDEMIYARAAGEVRSIEEQGGYAHVEMHPPTDDGEGVDRDIRSIYHVSREGQVDGKETLHWTYLGDIQSGEVTRCPECGRTYNADTRLCPHCEGAGFTTDEDGGDDDE